MGDLDKNKLNREYAFAHNDVEKEEIIAAFPRSFLDAFVETSLERQFFHFPKHLIR